MTTVKSDTDIVKQMHDILHPLESEDRMRIVASVMVLLGESAPVCGVGGPGPQVAQGSGGEYNPQANRWVTQNSLSMDELEKVIHVDQDTVELIAGKVPGSSKKEITVRGYLLVGVKNLLASGVADAPEAEVVAFLKNLGQYGETNHSTYRKALTNRVTGNKDSGFKLTAVGHREAAALIKLMAEGD